LSTSPHLLSTLSNPLFKRSTSLLLSLLFQPFLIKCNFSCVHNKYLSKCCPIIEYTIYFFGRQRNITCCLQCWKTRHLIWQIFSNAFLWVPHHRNSSEITYLSSRHCFFFYIECIPANRILCKYLPLGSKQQLFVIKR